MKQKFTSTQMSNDSYHARSEVSSSQLKCIHQYGPTYFKYIEPIYQNIRSVEALEFGSYIHSLILEPDTLSEHYFYLPKNADRRKKDIKELLLENEGKQEISYKDRIRGECMLYSFEHHSEAEKLRAASTIETSIVWTDNAFEVDCRARADMFIDNQQLVIDLKTTSNMDDFSEAVSKYRYELQGAHYQKAFSDGKSDLFMIIAVESMPPFRTECFLLSPIRFEQGMMQRDEALGIYADCLKTDLWLEKKEIIVL